MLKLFKYLKKSIIPILFIVFLLIIQAISDLSLPGYTSKIINVGIQQGGIEDVTPTILRESTFNKILLFLDDEDKTILENSYIKLDKNLLTSDGYNKYFKKYPLIKEENLYKLKNIDNTNLERLETILVKPIMMIGAMNSDKMDLSMFFDKFEVDENTDIFTILAMLPEEKRNNIMNEMNNKMGNLPESIIEQSAIEVVKKEYSIIGINVNRVQIDYILTTGAIMLLISLVSMIAAITVGLLGARVAAKVAQSLRGKVFKKIISFSETEFKKFSTASLITRTTNDIQQVQMVIVMMLRIVIYAPIMGIGGVMKVLSTNTSMGWIIGIAVACISVIVLTLFFVVIPKFKLLQKLVDKLNLVSLKFYQGYLLSGPLVLKI